MTTAERGSLAAVAVAVLLGAGLAWAGSQGGVTLAGWPLFALAIAAVFVVQWLVFVPSYAARTERFFDLTGSGTFIAVTLALVALVPRVDARGWLLVGMVVVWAARLGTFLFRRVSAAGHDDRFDQIKTSFPRFLGAWTLQGLWISVTASAAWIALTAPSVPLGWLALVGMAVWLAGFGIEVVADAQKSRFKADPAHRGRFVNTGLWSKSRHPNYFGEILLWIGVALVALPALSGWGYIGLLSPVFVALLLIRVSGIPMLEAKADARWGGDPAYEEYKRTTPVLVPRP